MPDPSRTIPLLDGPVFGVAAIDSARRFGTRARVMRYDVRQFELRDSQFDSHMVAVTVQDRPIAAYRRIDSQSRSETIVPRGTIIVPHGALHESVVPKPGAFIMAGIPASTWRETCEMLDVDAGRSPVPTFPEQRDEALSALLLHAAAVVDSDDLGRSVDLDTCLHRITVRLIAGHSGRHAEGRSINYGLTAAQVSRVADYIETHLAERLSIEDMAAEVALSRHHFLRQFRRATGQTPAQFAIAWRLARARALLATSAEPVSNVAARCGFTTEAHFSHTFRNRYGQSPSRFRQAAARA